MVNQENDDQPKSSLQMLLENRGYSDLEYAKKRYLWDINIKSSLLSVLRVRLTNFFLPDMEGEYEGKPDGSYREKVARQIVEDPLAYIKDVGQDSTQLDSIAGLIISHDGIDQDEANKIIEEALSLSGNSKEDAERILQLPEMAQFAADMLKKLRPKDEKEQKEDEQIESMRNTIKDNIDLSERKN